MHRRWSAESDWDPNEEEPQKTGWNAGKYFTLMLWDTDEISKPPMSFTDNPYGCPRDSLQIVSIKIATIRGDLQWPIHVFGMVTARDVLEFERKRNIVFARPRSNCQTITEEHPYLALTGPTRALVTSIDAGVIEIMLKVKGVTESDDRDLTFLVLPLKSSRYCSFHEDYTRKRSTLKLEFRHICRALEAIISVRLIGDSSLPPSDFQGVFTASTARIDGLEVVLLTFREGHLPIANDGTINLSRRVISVEFHDEEELKISILSGCADNAHVATRDDIVFTPQLYGRSSGIFNVSMCKMQVTVAWSLFDY
ncbi:unnamed protein product [Alopecurus aequalis]